MSATGSQFEKHVQVRWVGKYLYGKQCDIMIPFLIFLSVETFARIRGGIFWGVHHGILT